MLKDKDEFMKYINSGKLSKVVSMLPPNPQSSIEMFGKDQSVLPFRDNNCWDFKLHNFRSLNMNDYFVEEHKAKFKLETVLNEDYDQEIMSVLCDWLTPRGQKPDVETVQQLINAVYRMLKGEVSRYLNLLTGETKNGKSMFLKLLDSLYPLTSPLSQKIFIEQKNPSSISSELVALEKHRIGYFSEGSGKLNEELIKRITGGDSIVIRDLHKSEYTARVQCSIFMTCNKPPQTSGENAINARMRVWFFPNTYEVNHEFSNRIEKVLGPHFLGFIIRRANMDEPEVITEAMKKATEYITYQNDVIQQYLAETEDYASDPEGKFKLQQFKDDINTWLRVNNETPKKKGEISHLLDLKDFKEKNFGKEGRWRVGLRRTAKADLDTQSRFLE